MQPDIINEYIERTFSTEYAQTLKHLLGLLAMSDETDVVPEILQWIHTHSSHGSQDIGSAIENTLSHAVTRVLAELGVEESISGMSVKLATAILEALLTRELRSDSAEIQSIIDTEADIEEVLFTILEHMGPVTYSEYWEGIGEVSPTLFESVHEEAVETVEPVDRSITDVFRKRFMEAPGALDTVTAGLIRSGVDFGYRLSNWSDTVKEQIVHMNERDIVVELGALVLGSSSSTVIEDLKGLVEQYNESRTDDVRLLREYRRYIGELNEAN